MCPVTKFAVEKLKKSKRNRNLEISTPIKALHSEILPSVILHDYSAGSSTRSGTKRREEFVSLTLSGGQLLILHFSVAITGLKVAR